MNEGRVGRGREKYVLFLLILSVLAVWRMQSIDYAAFDTPEGAFDISHILQEVASVTTLVTSSYTTTTTATNSTKSTRSQTSASSLSQRRKPKATIAYAVSITACHPNELSVGFTSGAAVLKHSIHLSSIRNTNSTSQYDYRLVAFVHPTATLCVPVLEQLGYQILVRETPVNVTEIKNNTAMVNRVMKSGCCGEKEFLKLYSYTLSEYPAVVHLDLDTVILQPLDDLFDVMLLPPDANLATPASKLIHHAMWTPNVTHAVNAFFTRDYPMVNPGRKPDRVGVQGGFLVVRPNQQVFDELCAIIMAGHFVPGPGWGGKKLRYGGYYGAAQIQGLLSYFYGHFHPDTFVELNRCYYNQMADPPKDKKRNVCLTGEEHCQDCRDTDMADIKSAHFTLCQKPHWCPNAGDKWLREEVWQGRQAGLCMQLHHEWHWIRDKLEQSWGTSSSNDHAPTNRSATGNVTLNSFGHCVKGKGGRFGYKYIPLVLPTELKEPS
jgi:hypothetical protein